MKESILKMSLSYRSAIRYRSILKQQIRAVLNTVLTVVGKNKFFFPTFSHKNLFFISILLVTAVGFTSFKSANAYFSSSATSSNNTFSAAEVFPSPTPTPDLTNIADHIVISQIQVATPSATSSDFVELYNPTSSNINLTGFHLVKRTKTSTTSTELKAFSSSDIIQAHGFYLWASTDGGYNLQVGADVGTSGNITNDNSVAISDASDTIVDAVAWGSGQSNPLVEGSAFSTNPAPGESIERKAYITSSEISMESGGADEFKGNGFDSNDNSSDFVLMTTADPKNSSSPTESP